MVTLRILLRRSKEEGQEFSLDVQRDGCRVFGEHLRTRSPPVSWRTVAEYLDDSIAGDDFLGRTGLRRLLEELRPGDAVVCRDHSRLGRDALEVTIVVREIIRRRGARLFYYASGQEVSFVNAIDAATTFIQGVGAQMELEAIRARTREALRARVKLGRIAGGSCYGYTNVRKADGAGRGYTIAIVNPAEARIVREVFDLYLQGYGLGRIAARLNRRGVPSPFAGVRGTGSWSTGCLHEMLRRERYRGVYVHGVTDRNKEGGRRVARKAAPDQVLRVPVPSWRIISEDTWKKAQALLRRREASHNRSGPPYKYPLSGLARCGACGGPIGTARTKVGSRHVGAYGCSYHMKRGSIVCEVGTLLPVELLDRPLLEYLRLVVLPASRLPRFLRDVGGRVEECLAGHASADRAHLRDELGAVRSEQRRYARALATAPRVKEVARELNARSARIERLEKELALASLSAEVSRRALFEVPSLARGRLERFYDTVMAAPGAAHALLQALFERTLVFQPYPLERREGRRGRPRRYGWRVTMRANGTLRRKQR